MRRFAGLIVVGALCIWGAFWIGSTILRRALIDSPQRQWPMSLGTLDDVPRRYPDTTMSPGAARLLALATPLGIDMAPRGRGEPVPARPLEFVRGQFTSWAFAQIRTPTPEIEPMPSESGEYLAGRAADLTAVRTLLLSDEPVIWQESILDPSVPLPNLTGHMQLQRVLIGRALDRARFGDRGAWDDLQAAWHLMRPLTRRHELISGLIALAGAKNVDAAARKLPLPPPAWLDEVRTFDFRRPLIASFQADAWRIENRVYAETTIDPPEGDLGRVAQRAVDVVMMPYTRAATADLADRWHRMATEIATTRACSADAVDLAARHRPAAWNVVGRRMTTANLDSVWQRLLRFDAQREATIRALALRQGGEPQPESACSDGNWIYAPDGSSFRFSREINVGPNPIPLEFRLSR